MRSFGSYSFSWLERRVRGKRPETYE